MDCRTNHKTDCTFFCNQKKYDKYKKMIHNCLLKNCKELGAIVGRKHWTKSDGYGMITQNNINIVNVSKLLSKSLKKTQLCQNLADIYK